MWRKFTIYCLQTEDFVVFLNLFREMPHYSINFPPPPHPHPWRNRPQGQGLLIIEASRSHSDTSHAVRLLWTSYQSDAEVSNHAPSCNTLWQLPLWQPARLYLLSFICPLHRLTKSHMPLEAQSSVRIFKRLWGILYKIITVLLAFVS